MPQITLWAIKHKPSGNYLPQPIGRLGRGGSHTEPVSFIGTAKTQPRLLPTRANAMNCLAAWLRGKTFASRGGDWDSFEEDIWEEKQPHRIKEDMEVVPVIITLP